MCVLCATKNPFIETVILVMVEKLENKCFHEETGEKKYLGCTIQGSKNPLVRSYLRVPPAAGQVKIWMISNVNDISRSDILTSFLISYYYFQGKNKDGSQTPEYGVWHKTAKVDR